MPGDGKGGLSRRDFLKVAGMALAATEVTACTPLHLGPATATGGKIQLVYQDFNTSWFPGMAHDLLLQFQAKHPDLNVFYIPDPPDLVAQMPIDMQAGTAADVFQGCCTHFPDWAHKRFTLDLRPYVARDLDQETIKDWDPVQYRALFAADGGQFGLPKYHGALALYYNKDLFDQYGVPYPGDAWDHADYQRAMQALTQDRDGDGNTDLWGSMFDVSWDRVQVHVNGWGGHFVDPSNPSRCTMGAPEAVAALEWLRARMWDDHTMASLPDVDRLAPVDAFLAQKVAMVEEGSWNLKKILSGADFRIGVATFPAGPARKVTLATTDGFGIYSGTKHPEAAWELLKFLISKDYGRAMAKAAFLQPARASIVGDWVGYVQEQYREQTEGMYLAAFADGHIRGYSVVAEIFPNMATAQNIAQDAWDRILTLGQAPVSILSDVSQRIQDAQD